MKNIAIDGPAGAGKSSVAKRVSKKLGFMYVDTGALYRVLALKVYSDGLDYNEEKLVEAAISHMDLEVKYEDGIQHVYLNSNDVSEEIRKEDIGNIASKISTYKCVRDKLLSIQRNLAKNENTIMDGRDIGTVVLPDAFLKIYLTASADTRAKRRLLQLEEKGETGDFEKIKQDIINRDNQDMNRKIAPLKQAEDAIYLDTSNMSIDEVINKIISLYEEKL